MNDDRNPSLTPDRRHVEVVVLEQGREIASAILREDGAPSFRGSPLLPDCTRDLARCLLAATAEQPRRDQA